VYHRVRQGQWVASVLRDNGVPLGAVERWRRRPLMPPSGHCFEARPSGSGGRLEGRHSHRAHLGRGFRSSGIAVFSVRFVQRGSSPAIRLPRASCTAVLAAKNGAVCAAPLHSSINLGWQCFPSTDTDYWKAPGGIQGKEGLSTVGVGKPCSRSGPYSAVELPPKVCLVPGMLAPPNCHVHEPSPPRVV